MKRAIRYLRFSQKGQSMGSIERQELYTDQWLERNAVMLVDTFKDEGKSARSFDRPDFRKLQAFVEKHHANVDYLLLDQLDRFSRNAGEALGYVKMLQAQYSIQVVSVTEGIIFDYDTPGSFFRAGLQLLLAEEDNINRSIKVRGGIYTAMAKDGRFIYKNAPFGYRKVGEGKDRRLVIEEEEAEIVRYIYKAFLAKTPLKVIDVIARKMGFDVKGKMAISRILSNPTYAGLLRVRPFKEYDGGLFAGNQEPIIDTTMWNIVQQKMNVPARKNTKIDDNVPLRGILRCHCGRKLSGAASRGRHGGYFYYYKCSISKHNNVSAKKAHLQLLELLSKIKLPIQALNDVRERCILLLNLQLQSGEVNIRKDRQEKNQLEEKLKSLEEKFIKDQINEETYNRWYPTYQVKIKELNQRLASMQKGKANESDILDTKIQQAVRLDFLYAMADTLQKRQLIEMVFSGTLYYDARQFWMPNIADPFQSED